MLATIFILFGVELLLRKMYQKIKAKEGRRGKRARQVHRLSVIFSLLNLSLVIYYYVTTSNFLQGNTPS